MKIIKYIFPLFFLCGCSQTSRIETIISDIYGTNILPGQNKDEGTVYVLDYSLKREQQDKDVVKLKDKIDKVVNSIATLTESDLQSYSPDAVSSATKQCDCLSDVYQWNTPKIRILLITKRCVPDKGNDITIVVNEK